MAMINKLIADKVDNNALPHKAKAAMPPILKSNANKAEIQNLGAICSNRCAKNGAIISFLLGLIA
ncbi:hypothetical protein [Chryseotalea sanaruensis]|uniref:hypothetical protein n=1 Tax=Chryseotalea sanaruensis TaxID=2482724 RepID=UPI001C3FB571|nr:hypothetical protein [Chryseotalea sanaruensis]